MILRKVYALLFAFTLFASLTNAVSVQSEDLKKRLDTVINEAIKNEKIVGATMIVARDGKIVYRRTAGFNDREAKKPLRESDVFRLASLTKLIVSTAALALVDERKLDLDDPVAKYLPGFRPKLTDGREPVITVRQLMTHTAGLTYTSYEKPGGPYHRLNVSMGADGVDVSLEENLRRIAAAPLLYEPGTSWGCSVATDVLGAIVAKAGGASLPEVVRRKVTAPLKMQDAAFTAKDTSRLVIPYADGRERPVRMTEQFAMKDGDKELLFSQRKATEVDDYPSGGAGMVGTIDDYFRLLEVLRKGGSPILKPATARLIAENAIGEIPVSAYPVPDAWGWSLGASYLKDALGAKTPQSVGTWQWSGAYGHTYFVDPREKLTVVCMTDTAIAGMVGEFPTALVSAVYGK